MEVLGVPQPHPPAMQLRTTREPREALPAQSILLSSWVQAGTHRGVSEPVSARCTSSSNKDAGGCCGSAASGEEEVGDLLVCVDDSSKTQAVSVAPCV